MEARVKCLGHPIHPMLVVFPLALFSTAVLFDVNYLVTDADELATFSFWAIAGVGMALVTAWLGALLVYRLRVAVDDEANFDPQARQAVALARW